MSLTDSFTQQSASFKKTTASNNDLIQSVSVPVSLDRNGAKLRLYIQLNSEVLANPESLSNALDKLEQMFDLDTWSPSSSTNGFKKASYKRSY
jgi:hypothetical protein